MSLHTGTEQQYIVKDAAGNVVWQGACVVGADYTIKNSGASTILTASAPELTANTTDILQEVAVQVDGPNTTLGTVINLAANIPIVLNPAGNAIASATPGGFWGVALERFASGVIGRVAGPGSIISVRCTSGAIAVGEPIGGTATVGLCGTMTTVVTKTYSVGGCVKAAAQMGASGFYSAGVLVCPH